MAIYQEENEFNVTSCSDEDSIIERMMSDKNVRIRVRTMTLIENLPLINVVFRYEIVLLCNL